MKNERLILVRRYGLNVKEYFGSKFTLKSIGGMRAVTNPACLCSIAQRAKLSLLISKSKDKKEVMKGLAVLI